MTWMIYGANGYTGRLIAALAAQRGHAPVLAGRHPQRVLEAAQAHGLPACVFDLEDPRSAERHLAGIQAVLHCAGPFSATARPMLDACRKAGAHYLDITGEIDVFEMVHGRDAELALAGITAVPGVGFDVVPSDCLAAMLHAQLPDAQALTLAFMPRGSRTSPGTAKTMVEGLAMSGRVRRDGRLVAVPAGYKKRTIPFPGGDQLAMTIPWGDVSTAFYSTGIPNIEVYLGTPAAGIAAARAAGYLRWVFAVPGVTAALKRGVDRRVAGASAETRGRSSAVLWGEVTNARGDVRTLAMVTPDGYSLTADAAVRAVERLLAGGVPAGALTPSRAFGAGFVKELEGVEVLA